MAQLMLHDGLVNALALAFNQPSVKFSGMAHLFTLVSQLQKTQ